MLDYPGQSLRSVLGIDKEPVEPQSGADFGDVGVRQRQPESHLRPPFGERDFEMVGRIC
ncbi:hypothetical protein [Sphingopyxis sp. BE259]|uniref:hypothetical protein n=1 Tax=Sphingopyxis sp. BE259 TaxID=2817723 RepID=UPI00286A39F7|nr:hypothetical protein [Sphingopyxis sp. BE259]